MRYVKMGMKTPTKGTSYVLYELDENDSIVRMLTHVPASGEIKLHDNLSMKMRFPPDRVSEAAKEEFEYIWDIGNTAPQV